VNISFLKGQNHDSQRPEYRAEARAKKSIANAAIGFIIWRCSGPCGGAKVTKVIKNVQETTGMELIAETGIDLFADDLPSMTRLRSYPNLSIRVKETR
jgi:hypothetical protein